MSKLRVNAFSISIDGYGAGTDQSLENPLGAGGEALHEWIVGTNTFLNLSGHSATEGKPGRGGVDDAFTARSFENLGAWIMGRNMFGPERGPWSDDTRQQAAQGKDIRVGGGVATIRAYLTAGLIEELHIAIAPVLLGKGENLFGGIDLPSLGYRCSERTCSELATHVVLTR